MTSTDTDVVILGAGLAGLTAAYHIQKTQPSVRFTILEARNRVGGRLFATEMKAAAGQKVTHDLGGQWIGPLHTELLDLLKELNLSDKIYEQYLVGTKICWVDPKHIIQYKTELPFYNPMIYLEAYTFLKKVDAFADQLDANNPYLRNPALADYLDAMTIEAFLRQHIYNPELRELIRVGIRTTFGYETTQISALYCVLYGKASGKMDNLFSATNDGAQKLKLKGGMYQVSLRLAQEIGEKNIILNAPVTHIDQQNGQVTVTVSFNNGGSLARFNAKHVIVAIPPPHLLNITMNPPLSADRVALLRSMPMGNLFKFQVTYERAFWREKGLSGETVCYGGEPGSRNDQDCPVGPVSVTYDSTQADGSCPAITGFSAGHQTVYWDRESPEQRKEAILRNLAKMIGEEALTPIDYVEKNWAHEPWTGGCPVACLQPGAGRFFTSGIRQPHGNLHMAGTETAQQAIGYMSGAIQSGRRAAVEVLYAMGKHAPKDAVILASTCHGPAGRAQRWTIKWPSVHDPCMLALQSTNWGYKAVAAISIGLLLYRYFRNEGGLRTGLAHQCDRFMKLFA